MAKWHILDHLKLEMLVYRHRNLVASGYKRSEDEANRQLLKSVSEANENLDEPLLRVWAALKWEQLVQMDRRLACINWVRHVPTATVCMAVLIGVLSTLIPFLLKFTDKHFVISIPLLMGLYVALPSLTLLISFGLGCLRGAKRCFIVPFSLFLKRVTRTVQKTDTKIHNLHAFTEAKDSGATFFRPLLFAYVWCVRSFIALFARRGVGATQLSHETHMPIGEALIEALVQQSRALRLWSLRNLNLFTFVYFAVFLLGFLLLTQFKSLAFEWQRTDPQDSVVTENNIFTRIGAPWSPWVPLPTTEQMNAIKTYHGDAQPRAVDAWYAWSRYFMMAMLVYVLLPRLLLTAAQSLWLRYRFNAPDLRALRYESLILGMRHSPLLSPEESGSGSVDNRVRGTWHGDSASFSEQTRCCIITDQSLVEGSLREAFQRYLSERFKLAESASVVWMTLDSSSLSGDQFKQRLQQLLQPMHPLRASDRILLLIDSGQPPKSNYKTRTLRIREVAGNRVGIIYMLIHDEGQPVDRAAGSEALRVWTHCTRGWRDSNLEVEEYYQGGQQS
jgi:hypothetical protein